MKKVTALACIVAVLALTACAPKPSLVGKWTGNMEVQGSSVPATVEYKADKTFLITVGQQGINVEISGTYTSTDTEVTSTTGDIKIVGDLPAQAAAMKPMIEAELAKQKGKVEKSTYKLTDADTVEYTSEKGTKFTMTRVKDGK